MIFCLRFLLRSIVFLDFLPVMAPRDARDRVEDLDCDTPRSFEECTALGARIRRDEQREQGFLSCFLLQAHARKREIGGTRGDELLIFNIVLSCRFLAAEAYDVVRRLLSFPPRRVVHLGQRGAVPCLAVRPDERTNLFFVLRLRDVVDLRNLAGRLEDIDALRARLHRRPELFPDGRRSVCPPVGGRVEIKAHLCPDRLLVVIRHAGEKIAVALFIGTDRAEKALLLR